MTRGGVTAGLLWTVAGILLFVVVTLSVPGGREVPVANPKFDFPVVETLAGRGILRSLGPQWVLLGAGLVALLLGRTMRRRGSAWAYLVAFGGLAWSAVLVLHLRVPAFEAAGGETGPFALDPYATFGELSVLALTGMALLGGLRAGVRRDTRGYRGVAALLVGTAGMTAALAAKDLVAVFGGLVLAMACNAMLLGRTAGEGRRKAASKYLPAALLAGAAFLGGTVLLYLATDGTGFEQLAERLASLRGAGDRLGVMRSGVGLLLASLAFLAGAAPFHAALSEAYSTRRASGIGFVAAASVAGALLLIIRLTQGPLAPWVDTAGLLVLGCGAVSVVVGSLGAWAREDSAHAAGHLGVVIVGLMLVAMARRAMPMVEPGEVASLLGGMLAVYAPVAVVASATSGASARNELHWLTRALSSGTAFVLAGVTVYGALMLLTGARRADGAEAVLIYCSGTGLVVAAARFFQLCAELALKDREWPSGTSRYAAAAAFLALVGAIMVPLLMVPSIARALNRTWP